MRQHYHDQTHSGGDLTHELSYTNPDVFRDRLVRSVATNTMFGGQVLTRAMGYGSDPRRMVFDPRRVYSATDIASGDIRLGTAPMPADLRDKVMFRDDRFTYQDEMTWRYMHELLHVVLERTADTPSMDALTDAVFNTRGSAYGQYGLSGLGSLDYYQGQYKAREDTVELLTMYAYDPGMLAEYTNFLADESVMPALGDYGLIPLDPSNADYIFRLTESALTNNI
jgi:hypothetical protein